MLQEKDLLIFNIKVSLVPHVINICRSEMFTQRQVKDPFTNVTQMINIYGCLIACNCFTSCEYFINDMLMYTAYGSAVNKVTKFDVCRCICLKHISFSVQTLFPCISCAQIVCALKSRDCITWIISNMKICYSVFLLTITILL